MQAKYDAALSDNEKLKADAEKAATDFKNNFDSAVKNRVELLQIADKHKIEKADKLTDSEIKIAVVKKVRGINLIWTAKAKIIFQRRKIIYN